MLLLVTAGLETRPRLTLVPNTSGKSAEIALNGCQILKDIKRNTNISFYRLYQTYVEIHLITFCFVLQAPSLFLDKSDIKTEKC